MSFRRFMPLLVVIAAAMHAATAHAALVSAGSLFVDLDARHASAGTANWTNTGSLGGSFTENGNPLLQNIGPNANLAVTFNGTTDFYRGANAPAGVTGAGAAGTRSIEVWTFNPSAPGEESLVSLAKRGGPDGSNVAFNYGTDGNFGAVGHWANADIGWNGTPPTGTWQHLVYTFDGTTTRVYANGILKNSENSTAANGGVPLDAHDNVNMLIAAQMEPDGNTVTGGLRGSLSIANVRVHDGVLSSADVRSNFREDAARFGVLTNVPITNWNFQFADTDNNVQGAQVTNGQVVVDGGLFSSSPITPAENAADNGHNLFGGSTTYATYNPATEGIAGRVGADGFALNTTSGYPFWNDSGSALQVALATNRQFSGFARAKRTGDGDAFESLLSRPGNWRIGVDADGTIAAVFGGVSFDTNVPFAIGAWRDVAFTYDGDGSAGGIVDIYIDGVLAGSFAAGAFGTGDVFHIGDGPAGSESFLGLFDNVQFFAEVLDSRTVNSLTNPVVPEPASALLGVMGLAGLALRRRRVA